MYLAEFLTIAIAHLVAVASPGPDFAIVMRHSIRHGRRGGVWTSSGIALGILLHCGYCVLGVGVLLSTTPVLFNTVKVVAAIYLVLLGYRAIQASRRSAVHLAEPVQPDSESPWKWLVTGFLTNGLNPKATLFFLALFTVIIDIQTPVAVQALYGIYLSLATFAWFALLSVVLGIAGIRSSLLRAGAWFERLMGLVLIGLGVQLVVSLPPVSG